jgi:hypothetical protein
VRDGFTHEHYRRRLADQQAAAAGTVYGNQDGARSSTGYRAAALNEVQVDPRDRSENCLPTTAL